MGLEAALRSGEAVNRQGGEFSEEDQRIFSEGVEALTAGPAAALAANYDFARHQRVLDLGGGTGQFLLAILRRHTALQGTLFELPGAAAVARQRLGGEPEGNRVRVIEGNFLTNPIPAGHDVMLIANVVHLFLPEQNRQLFQRARDAAAEGARLLIVDFVTDSTHTTPMAAALVAGEFLVLAGHGDVYSEEELRAWLQDTGWRPLERTPLGGQSLLTAEAS